MRWYKIILILFYQAKKLKKLINNKKIRNLEDNYFLELKKNNGFIEL